MHPMARGVTLLEIMIASAIATVIAFGLMMVEGTRARMTEEMRHRVEDEPERKNAALAALRITKELETADLFNPSSGTTTLLNVRIPECPTPPTCSLDSFASYQWVQFRLTGNELRMYRFPRTTPWPPTGCPAAQVLASDITALSFTPTNNGATYVVTWTSTTTPTRNQTFQGQVISRFRPDQTGFAGGLDSSGTISPPPGVACP